MGLFECPNKMCTNVYLDTCPIGQSTLTLIDSQLGYTSNMTSLYRRFGLRLFGRKCAVELNASKYANM